MAAQVITIPDNRNRTVREVDGIGMNLGGRHAINSIADFNAASPNVEVALRGIDVNPNNLLTSAAEATQRGVQFMVHHGRGEDVVEHDGTENDRPIICATDDPRANARICRAAAATGRALLLYLLIRMPTKALIALTVVIGKGDAKQKERLALFLDALADATVRRGSQAVLGVNALPEHVFLEPHFRLLFRAHLTTNLPKLLWDLDPDAAPIEISFDGEKRLPVVVEDSRAGWRDAQRLASDVLARQDVVIEPGKDLAIAEIGPDGIRLHVARMRALDRSLSVNDTTDINAEAFAEALRRAERQAIGRLFPVYTTD